MLLALRRLLLISACLACVPSVNAQQYHQQPYNPCGSRCRYCVDGVCVPRRVTYGYHEPNWRRWPAGPPEVMIAGPSQVNGSSDGAAVEPPSPLDEADGSPRFPHLRPRDGVLGPAMDDVPMVPGDAMPNNPFNDEPGIDVMPPVDTGEVDDDFSDRQRPLTVSPVAYQSSAQNPLRGGVMPTTQLVKRLPAARPSFSELTPVSTRPPALSQPPASAEDSDTESESKSLNSRRNNPLRG